MTCSQTTTISATVWEDSTPHLMARIAGADAAAIVQADVSSISYQTVDKTDTATPVGSGALVVADVVYDTLQTDDARWTVDTTGYNFRHPLPGTAIPTGGVTYLVQYQLTMADASKIYFEFELFAKPHYFD